MINDTIKKLEKQLGRQEVMLMELGVTPLAAGTEPLIFFMECLFTAIRSPQGANPALALLE